MRSLQSHGSYGPLVLALKKKSLVGALTEEDAEMVGLFWSDN